MARPKRSFRPSEEGQAYVELVIVLPIFIILMAAMIYFGRLLYVKLALDMVTYDACRAAVESMDESSGIYQGIVAGRNTILGWSINPTAAQVSVQPQSSWDRGTIVICRASYDVFVGDIPGIRTFITSSSVHLTSTAANRVETYRSIWQ
jgi:Flp pilus assembly protein TadG